MSKRIGFNATRLQSIDPGAYAHLPATAKKTGSLSFYYTYDGCLRSTDGSITYAYIKGAYDASRKRYAYSWQDVTATIGK